MGQYIPKENKHNTMFIRWIQKYFIILYKMDFNFQTIIFFVGKTEHETGYSSVRLKRTHSESTITQFEQNMHK